MASLTTVLLCDFAQVREGLLTVVSGGITRLRVPAEPTEQEARIPLHVAVVVEMRADETTVNELRVTLSDPTTTEVHFVGTVSFQRSFANLERGEPALIPVAMVLPVPVNRHGQWDVRVSIGEESQIVSFWTLPADEVDRAPGTGDQAGDDT